MTMLKRQCSQQAVNIAWWCLCARMLDDHGTLSGLSWDWGEQNFSQQLPQQGLQKKAHKTGIFFKTPVQLCLVAHSAFICFWTEPTEPLCLNCSQCVRSQSWRWLRFTTEVENKRRTHLDFIWGSQQTWTGFTSHKMVILKLFLSTVLHHRLSFYPPVEEAQNKCYQVSDLIRKRAAAETNIKINRQFISML